VAAVRDVVSVSRRTNVSSRSHLGLGYLRLVPKTLFSTKFAGHINKMSQISSRYIWHGALEVDSMIIIIIIIIIINGRENKLPRQSL